MGVWSYKSDMVRLASFKLLESWDGVAEKVVGGAEPAKVPA
jgi:hypothetical protein